MTKILSWDEIYELYPKSGNLLKEFLLNNIIKEVDISKEEIEFMFSTILAPQICSASRTLYDFFDEHKIYIVIDCMDYIEGGEWMPIVVNTDIESKSTRIEAENLAFLEAFNLLEKELNINNEALRVIGEKL